MKPSTQARIDRLVNRVSDHLTPGQAAAFREIVEYEMKEQDRDTRHACAEAMLALPYDMIHTDAHAACINVQSI